jgi:hypothetical protein
MTKTEWIVRATAAEIRAIVAEARVKALEEAVAAEREACAKVALPAAVPSEWMEDSGWPARLAEMKRIAAAIRALSTLKDKTND